MFCVYLYVYVNSVHIICLTFALIESPNY